MYAEKKLSTTAILSISEAEKLGGTWGWIKSCCHDPPCSELDRTGGRSGQPSSPDFDPQPDMSIYIYIYTLVLQSISEKVSGNSSSEDGFELKVV